MPLDKTQSYVAVAEHSVSRIDFFCTLALELVWHMLDFVASFAELVQLAQCSRMHHALVWTYYCARRSPLLNTTVAVRPGTSSHASRALAAVAHRSLCLNRPPDHSLAVCAAITGSATSLQALELEGIVLTCTVLQNFKYFGALGKLVLRNCVLCSDSGSSAAPQLISAVLLQRVRDLTVEFTGPVLSIELTRVLETALQYYAPVLEQVTLRVFCLSRAALLLRPLLWCNRRLQSLRIHTLTLRDACDFIDVPHATGLCNFEFSSMPGAGVPGRAPLQITEYLLRQLVTSFSCASTLQALDLSGSGLLLADLELAHILLNVPRLRYVCLDGQLLASRYTANALADLKQLCALTVCGLEYLRPADLVRLYRLQQLCVRQCNTAADATLYYSLVAGLMPELAYLDVRNCKHFVCSEQDIAVACAKHPSLRVVYYNVNEVFQKS